jgi:hypothetical protein
MMCNKMKLLTYEQCMQLESKAWGRVKKTNMKKLDKSAADTVPDSRFPKIIQIWSKIDRDLNPPPYMYVLANSLANSLI